jgi:hypothetical protein
MTCSTRIAASALAVVISATPAFAALETTVASSTSRIALCPSIQLASMMAYTWTKGQKSGGVKSTPAPPPHLRPASNHRTPAAEADPAAILERNSTQPFGE